MFFTREDYQNIANYLKQNGKKDSDFPKTQNIGKHDFIAIVQEGNNKSINVVEFINTILPLLKNNAITEEMLPQSTLNKLKIIDDAYTKSEINQFLEELQNFVYEYVKPKIVFIEEEDYNKLSRKEQLNPDIEYHVYDPIEFEYIDKPDDIVVFFDGTNKAFPSTEAYFSEGPNVAVNAGEYEYTVYPEYNYIWSDRTLDIITVTVAVVKELISKPTIINHSTSEGKASFNDEKFTVTGEYSSEVGTYVLKAVPKIGYRWEDGTKDEVEFILNVSDAWYFGDLFPIMF